MEVYIFIYKGFAQFESIIPSYIASATGNVYTVGIDKVPVMYIPSR